MTPFSISQASVESAITISASLSSLTSGTTHCDSGLPKGRRVYDGIELPATRNRFVDVSAKITVAPTSGTALSPPLTPF